MQIKKTMLSIALVLGSAAFASAVSAQEGGRHTPVAEYLGISEDLVASAFGEQDPPDIAAVAAALDITAEKLEEALEETRKNAPPPPEQG